MPSPVSCTCKLRILTSMTFKLLVLRILVFVKKFELLGPVILRWTVEPYKPQAQIAPTRATVEP